MASTPIARKGNRRAARMKFMRQRTRPRGPLSAWRPSTSSLLFSAVLWGSYRPMFIWSQEAKCLSQLLHPRRIHQSVPFMANNEAEVASVLGHKLGHITARSAMAAEPTRDAGKGKGLDT